MEFQSQNKLEIHQLLVRIGDLLEKDEKFELKDKGRIKFENDELKLKLVEMNGKIQQMSDQLQQKDVIISEQDKIIDKNEEKLKHQDNKIGEQFELLQQKDSVIAKNQVVIAQRDELVHQQEVIISDKVELLKQKEHIIVDQNELLQQKNVLVDHHLRILERKKVIIAEQKVGISEQADFITELNVIIDEKELEIIRKEDFIEQKIDMIRNLELRIANLNHVMSSMSQHISEQEIANNSARRQLNANIRTRQPGRGETLFDQLKMKYKNAMVRFQHREKDLVDKIAALEQYNSFLHASLEQNENSDVEVREMNYAASAVLDETTDGQHNMAVDNDENKHPNVERVGLDYEDSNFNRVESELLRLVDDESDKKQVMQTDDCSVPKQSFSKKSSKKKIPKPRKKIKFSKNITAVFFSS